MTINDRIGFELGTDSFLDMLGEVRRALKDHPLGGSDDIEAKELLHTLGEISDEVVVLECRATILGEQFVELKDRLRREHGVKFYL